MFHSGSRLLPLLFAILFLLGCLGPGALYAQVRLDPQVNGRNVQRVEYNSPGLTGFYQQTGPLEWEEYRSDKTAVFSTFKETGRDDDSVYLTRDDGPKFQLDLRRKIIIFLGRLVHNITEVSAGTGGTTNIPAPKPHLSAFAAKMNVLYIGVNNPISLNTSSTAPTQVSVVGAGARIHETGINNYNVTVNTPGEVTMTIRQGDTSVRQKFRAKRIPDPMARINNQLGGTIGFAAFKSQPGVAAFLSDFGFDVKCKIVGFNLTLIMTRQDGIQTMNNGPSFSVSSRRLINEAKPGFTYTFTEVKAKCPGDTASRDINSMVFTIR